MADLPLDRLLRRAQVEQVTNMGGSSIYAEMHNPDPEARFPHPIKIGMRRSRWSERAVMDWIARQQKRSAS